MRKTERIINPFASFAQLVTFTYSLNT